MPAIGRAGRHVPASLVALWLASSPGGCGSPYPIAPTRCDDWCRATQRARCDEDDPFACVAQCEEELRSSIAGCDTSWDALASCYLAAPAEAFFCQQGYGVPVDVCADAASVLGECVAGAANLCVSDCVRRRAQCGGSAWSCGSDCRSLPPECEVQANAMYACFLGTPITCESERVPGSMPPEDKACFDPILEYFACTKGGEPADAGAELPPDDLLAR